MVLILLTTGIGATGVTNSGDSHGKAARDSGEIVAGRTGALLEEAAGSEAAVSKLGRAGSDVSRVGAVGDTRGKAAT